MEVIHKSPLTETENSLSKPITFKSTATTLIILSFHLAKKILLIFLAIIHQNKYKKNKINRIHKNTINHKNMINFIYNKLSKVFLLINTNSHIPINNVPFAYNNSIIKKLLKDCHVCTIFINNAAINGFLDH